MTTWYVYSDSVCNFDFQGDVIAAQNEPEQSDSKVAKVGHGESKAAKVGHWSEDEEEDDIEMSPEEEMVSFIDSKFYLPLLNELAF